MAASFEGASWKRPSTPGSRRNACHNAVDGPALAPCSLQSGTLVRCAVLLQPRCQRLGSKGCGQLRQVRSQRTERDAASHAGHSKRVVGISACVGVSGASAQNCQNAGHEQRSRFVLCGRRGARAGSPPADPPDVGLRIGPARRGVCFWAVAARVHATLLAADTVAKSTRQPQKAMGLVV